MSSMVGKLSETNGIGERMNIKEVINMDEN